MSEPDRASTIAEFILEELAPTEEGHCTRVDFLDRAESLATCRALRRAADEQSGGLSAFVLRSARDGDSQTDSTDLLITADRAIERRNRKEARVCLFVPADIVDAAASSLGNAFAPIDGRALHAEALARLRARAPAPLAETVRRCFGRLRGNLRASDADRLDFLEAVTARAEIGEADRIGLELWRLGLLPDAGADFLDRLEANGRHARELSRPERMQAPLRDRVQRLGVDDATSAALLKFLDGRPLHDVRAWARDLAREPWTLDRWVFPETDRTDLRAVTVKSFVDANGVVTRSSKLRQPDGPAGSLVVDVGPKQKLTVGWTSDPLRPTNLAQWRAEIVPVSEELDDATAALPSREVPSRRDTATLSLDLGVAVDELPNAPMCVRVVPLDAVGNEVTSEDGQPIIGTSEEFFLREGGDEVDTPTARLSTVPSLAFGRLKAALAGSGRREEQHPQWVARDLDYFTLRLNDRTSARVGLAAPLRALEAQVITEPRQGGRYRLDCEDASIVNVEAFKPELAPVGEHGGWADFWRARQVFFQRIGRSEVRNLIEVADWTPELANSAIRYAQAYRELVDALAAQDTSREGHTELLDALSLDTVLVRTVGVADADEPALLVLPTHPLRTAWYASYTQLLNRWEAGVDELDGPPRRHAVELGLLEALAPSNTPPFAYWPDVETAFVFFQNLRFFYGVALPPDVPDPHRRFADLAHVLGAGDDSSAGDLRPQRLADHLQDYRTLHPYARRLELTLLNPDRGDLVADTLEAFLRSDLTPSVSQEDDGPGSAATFAIQAYVETGRETPLRGLERVRGRQAEEYRVGDADIFLPTLESSVKTMADLDEAVPREAHVAVASDLAQPRLVPSTPQARGARQGSFSLHGLIARFVADFSAEGDTVRWLHHLAADPAARPEPHPAGPRFGDTVMDLQATLLAAGARLLDGADGAIPALEVRVTPERRRLLEALHRQSDWVISIDRFFGPDYYDSPREAHLSEAARKYLLDYTPELSEGLGHRVLVTTAWQDAVLRRLRATIPEIGLSPDGGAASALLDHLKMVSGRLALHALTLEPGNAQPASLAAVTAWLRARGRLAQAILIPVRLHGHLLGGDRTQLGRTAEELCDCMLVTLRRNIVEATFIAVRWRRGDEDVNDLAYEMLLPLERTERVVNSRFFGDTRVDGALQRAQLASVLRFYFERARRYGVFESTVEPAFLEQLARLEKTGLDFRAKHEGYIVASSEGPARSFFEGDARFTVLRPADLESGTEFARRYGPDGLPLVHQAALDLTTPLATPSAEWSGDVDTAVGSLPTRAEAEVRPTADGGETVASSPSAGIDELEVRTARFTRTQGDVIITDADEEVVGETPETSGEDRAVAALRADGPVEVSVLLGHASPGETPVYWQPSVQGSPHMFVLGIPGQGKSWSVARVVGELSKRGVPSLILDFHGQFTATEGPLAGARQGTVLDARAGLPFSPLELGSAAGDAVDWQTNAFAIAEIFGYVCKLGDMQRDVVFTAVRDAYRSQGFGREAEDGPADAGYPTLRDVLTRIERQERLGRATNVAARCRPLLEMDLFRPPAAPAEDLLSMVRRGLVVDLHRLADLELMQLGAGAFILRKLYKDMFSWGQADHLRLLVVLDEAHRLSRDVTLPKLMKEGRKFGIAVVVASQGIADFHADVLSNAGTKVVFRMNHPDSRRGAGFIRAPQGIDLAARIEQLRVGEAYVQTPAMRLGSMVRMSPP